MKILEEFWYGNIEPTDYDTSSCKEYKKLQETLYLIFDYPYKYYTFKHFEV